MPVTPSAVCAARGTVVKVGGGEDETFCSHWILGVGKYISF